MLTFLTGSSPDCSGISRRSFLQIGGLATFGLTLPQFLQAKQESYAGKTPVRGKAVSCILLWMQGGPSHIDTFDPKPDAPIEIRGEFDTVPTTLPGVRVCEHLPLLARQTDKFSIIRGHDPKNGSHGTADHLMMSGHPFNASLAFPCYGSVVAKERGYPGAMFPFVQLGRNIDRRFNGGIAGILGDQFNAFEVPEDPNANGFRVRDLSLDGSAEHMRHERRYAMLREMESYKQKMESAATPVQARDAYYEKAQSLITSPAASKRFDLTLESARTREAYGRNLRTGLPFGASTDRVWRSLRNSDRRRLGHAPKNFRTLKSARLPRLDRAYSALLQDLFDRGLLDSTLVVWFGDFGPYAQGQSSAGRDHWASAGVACMGGGGVRWARSLARPTPWVKWCSIPVTPQDLAQPFTTPWACPCTPGTAPWTAGPSSLLPEGKPVKQLVR